MAALPPRCRRAAARCGYSGVVEVASDSGIAAAARCTERQASRNIGTCALGNGSDTRKPWIEWQP